MESYLRQFDPMLFLSSNRPSVVSSAASAHDEVEIISLSESNISPPKPAFEFVLPELSAVAFSCILEECINQLAILGNIGDLSVADVELNYKTLEEKYSTPHRTFIYDPNTIQTYDVVLQQLKIQKFQKDRLLFEKVLRQLKIELFDSYSFDSLMTYLENYRIQNDEEEQLLEEAQTGKLYVKDLKDSLQYDKYDIYRQIDSTTEEIGRLRDTFEEQRTENEIKLKYVKEWEEAREESHDLELDMKDEQLLGSTKYYQSETEREQRVNMEMELFLTEVIKEQEQQIAKWIEKYDKEIELRDTEIQILKEKREEQFTQLEELAKLYEQHRKEIEDYLVVKEIRRQEQEKLNAQIRACTIIQSWWRGIMVRKCLGPYRKKRKGKKGKGKDKKKPKRK